MVEKIEQDTPIRTSREQATRHLFDTLRSFSPVILRASVDSIVYDAQEYADWMSQESVLNAFTCKNLAQSSLRYGTTAVVEPIHPDTLLRQFDSPKFQKFQKTVCDRVQEPEVRSLIFFSQGVKLGAAALRAKRSV